MLKKNIFMCLLAICLAHITFINGIFANGADIKVSCDTQSVDNSFTTIDKTKSETCGICKWRTVRAGWKPEDGAGAQYEYHEASASASVQTCKGHDSRSCTSVLMTGAIICPSDDGSAGSEG